MILSLDPGSARIGWARTTLDGQNVDYGFLSPIDDAPKNLPFNQKMNLLIRRLIPEFKMLLEDSTHVAWEIVPSFGQMAQRELVQATATTLKVLTIIQKKPYQQFTPQAWHKQFVGKAKCTKDEVKSCILSDNTISCKIKNDLPYDTYDAIAIGVTAARKNEWIEIEWV